MCARARGPRGGVERDALEPELRELAHERGRPGCRAVQAPLHGRRRRRRVPGQGGWEEGVFQCISSTFHFTYGNLAAYGGRKSESTK